MASLRPLQKFVAEVRFELVSQFVALYCTRSPKYSITPRGPPTSTRCKIMSEGQNQMQNDDSEGQL